MDRQNLLIDADDTLWENNLYFEEAFERFCELLDHSSLNPDQVREALDRIEIENNQIHGYGSLSFVRNLRQCFESLFEREPQPHHFDEIASYSHAIMERPIELMPGVSETLPHLASKHDLTLFTKGAQAEQRSKIERSGIGAYFKHFEIVKEKNAAAYLELVRRRQYDPDSTWMIGNSPKSDVNPALTAGLRAVYVPHQRTWTLEREPIAVSDRLLIAQGFAGLAGIFC